MTSHHVTVISELDSEILARKIVVGYGQHRNDMNWQNVSTNVAGLLNMLSSFEVGQKDGKAILQGELGSNGRRVAKNMARNYLMIVDVDTGVSVDHVGQILHNKGLFGVIWTTHSFGKAETEISEEHFLRWCKKNSTVVRDDVDELLNLLCTYLRDEKRYDPTILELEVTSYGGRHLRDGGVKYVVKHRPMPKLRVLFLLDQPFDFLAGNSQTARIEEWKKTYADVCEWLNVPYDSSCVDPSRLMYTPRIPPGAEIGEGAHEILVFGGKPLDLDTVTSVTNAPNPFLAHAEGTADDRPQHEFVTKGLTRFVAECPDFDIIGFMESTFPDDKRHDGTDPDKSEWACPNEDGHSEQKADDRAFMVSINAAGNWYAGCLHDGCKHASGGDRLWYLDLLCQKAGITDARELEAWSASAKEKQLKAAAAARSVEAGAHEAAIAALTQASSVQEITNVIKMLAPLSDPLEQAAALNAIKKKTGNKVPLPELKKALKAHTDAHNRAIGIQSSQDDDTPSDPREPEPDDPDKATEIWDHWSFDKRFFAFRSLMIRENEKEPRIFKTEDGRVIYVKTTEMGAKIVDAKPDVVTWHTIGRIQYKNMDRLTGDITSDKVPKDLIETLLADLSPPWPTLSNVVNTPIVLPDGTQAYKRGYIPELGLFLDPPDDCLPLPEVVTEDDVESAYAIILDCIRDFPFVDYNDADADKPIMGETLDDDGHPYPNLDRGRGSRANCFAMIIEPFARHLIDGAAPMYYIDKPAPGSGAGYLADVAFIATQATRAVAQTMSDNNEEFRKAITAVLREGSPIVFVDNVNRKVDSGPLAAAITNGTWQDRILGESTVTKIRIENTWMLAGNNVEFTPEIMRRLVPIRLDARVPNPAFDRPKTAFKHNPLQDYLIAKRPEVIQAINTLVKNWIDKGAPRSGLTFNSFDNWVAVMGGILEAAGITGFLSNLVEFNQVKNVDDDDKNEYGRLMFERYKFSYFTKAEALLALKGNGFGGGIELPIKADKDDSITANDLRKWMLKHMDGGTFYINPEKTQLVSLKKDRITTDRSGWRFIKVQGFDEPVKE